MAWSMSASFIGVLILVLAWGPARAAELQSSIFLRDDSFISSDYSASSAHSFNFVGAQLNNVDSKNPSLFTVNASGALSPEAGNMSYLNVRDLYVEKWGLAVGRKLNTWSRLDEMWHLGFYQPQFTWNPLLPESQGLTGLFWNIKNGDSQFPIGAQFFASALYIPDQGPSYTTQNGQFVPNSPWNPQLPTSVNINGTINQTAWNIHTPGANEVVFQKSYAAEFYLGRSDQGFQLLASAAYKPANQLEVAINTATNSSGTTKADLYPELFNHSLESLDLRYSWSLWHMGLGGLLETPQGPQVLGSAPSNLTVLSYGQTQMISPYVGWRSKMYSAQLSYLNVQSDRGIPQGLQSAYLQNSLLPRVSYGSAAKAEIGYGPNIAKQKSGIELRTTYMQGTDSDFTLWTSSLNWKLNRSWILSSGLVLVQADPNAALTNIFQQYQNNDSLSLGGAYAF